MGDRANIVFNTEVRQSTSRLEDYLPGSIVLYSHWGGHDLGPDLAAALRAARKRWDDEGYGIRIVVSQMIGEQWKEETGYGLHVGLIADNERPVVVCDFSSRKVIIFGDGRGEYPFDVFAELNDENARKAHLGDEDE